jgi:hypothetical protein
MMSEGIQTRNPPNESGILPLPERYQACTDQEPNVRISLAIMSMQIVS